MACYHPLYRIEDYEGKVHILSKSDFEQDIKNYHFYKKVNPVKAGYWKRADMIPCGKCIGCRLEYSREWANRIVLESKMYPNDECWFVTLTYSDENLPFKTVYSAVEGKNIVGSTLVKEDLQNFFKRLRYRFNTKHCKYYACGEYGNVSERPHYHICLFGITEKELELKFHGLSEAGDPLYESKSLSKIWDKGYVMVGDLTWDSAAYVARYVMKKQRGPEAELYYKAKAKEPEFVTMSLKPAIGFEYYEQNKESIYENDEIIIPKKGGAVKIKPPKYYDKMYKEENPERMGEIKRQRERVSQSVAYTNYRNHSLEPQEYREVQERTKQEQARALKRNI